MGDYARTERWLLSLEMSKGMDLKLERVRAALRALGDPQRALRCFHVAGTNGKGSVVAMLASILGAAGYRAGMYTSPHLVRLGERIRIGDEEIARDEIVESSAEIRSRSESAGVELTFFEFVTVMAFLHFARRAVDVAVIEVGLGGRLDATNVVDPLVAAITTIGLEHTRWLGNTLEQVAAEKGGIIKTGRPVVLGRVGQGARQVLTRLASERGAAVIDVPPRVRVGEDGTFDYRGADRELRGLRVALHGRFQIDNASVAVAAVDAAREALPVEDEALRCGLVEARWPGRLEVVRRSPDLVLDCAHNPDGMRTLVRELPALLAGRRTHVLFAVMGDKDWQVMVELLAPLCASATVTEVVEQRAVPAARLAEAFAAYTTVEIERDPLTGLQKALARASANDAVLVTGSLFLVGAVYETARAAQDVASRAG